MPGVRHTVAAMAALRNNFTADGATMERAHEKEYRALLVPIDVRSSVCPGGTA